MSNQLLVIVNIAVFGLNLAVLGLTLKPYTEYFKDMSIARRGTTKQEPRI